LHRFAIYKGSKQQYTNHFIKVVNSSILISVVIRFINVVNSSILISILIRFIKVVNSSILISTLISFIKVVNSSILISVLLSMCYACLANSNTTTKGQAGPEPSYWRWYVRLIVQHSCDTSMSTGVVFS
jgi:hypothetical protein